jgi:hypothetical protein
MPTVLDAPSPAVGARPADDDAHRELDDAGRRWLTEGESPEVIAAYAHALRRLIGDL